MLCSFQVANASPVLRAEFHLESTQGLSVGLVYPGAHGFFKSSPSEGILRMAALGSPELDQEQFLLGLPLE